MLDKRFDIRYNDIINRKWGNIMKKRIFALAMALVMLLALSGCGECSHKWTEASCEEAAVCSKCGETQGQALGHSWQPADCSTPETCLNCGATQGEVLPHSYSRWELTDTQMSRSCTVCGAEESGDIDYQLCLTDLLEGYWDFYAIIENGQENSFTYNYRDEAQRDYVEVIDGKLTLYIPELSEADASTLGMYTFEHDCIFDEYDDSDGAFIFDMIATDDSGDCRGMVIPDGDSDTLYIAMSADYMAIYTKNAVESAAFTGEWAAMSAGKVYTLNLAADRTLTGDIDGAVTGKWQTLPLVESGGTYYTGIVVNYEKDGKIYTDTDTIWVCYSDGDPKAELASDYFGFGLNIDGEYFDFEKTTAEELEIIVAAGEQSTDKLVGTWKSVSVDIYNLESGEEESKETSDHSLSFAEDGSFAAALDKEMSGTWIFDKAILSGDTLDLDYTVDLGVAEDGSVIYGYVTVYESGDMTFSFNADGFYYNYELVRST